MIFLQNRSLESILFLAIAGLVGLTFHEAAHAFVAVWLGDNTPAREGRLTLNPKAHLDPLGFILILLVGFGWAKPVHVDPGQMRYGPRVGNAIVAAAGPLTNLLIALVVAIPYRMGLVGSATPLAENLIRVVVGLNVLLFFFNLIPLAPLDGNSVLNGLVGDRIAQTLAPLRMYGPQILMGLMVIGFISPRLNFLGAVLWPAVESVSLFVLGG